MGKDYEEGGAKPGEKPCTVIVHEKVYDLKKFVLVHPGGIFWFAQCHGRDITTAVYAYHKNPEVQFKILEKYKTDENWKDIIHPY